MHTQKKAKWMDERNEYTLLSSIFFIANKTNKQNGCVKWFLNLWFLFYDKDFEADIKL